MADLVVVLASGRRSWLCLQAAWLLSGRPGGDDERLSCAALVCLLQPCNTCCTFEDAFAPPLNLEMLTATRLPPPPPPHPQFFRVSRYPRNHIICRASAPFAAAGQQLFSFFLFLSSLYDTRCSCFFSCFLLFFFFSPKLTYL